LPVRVRLDGEYRSEVPAAIRQLICSPSTQLFGFRPLRACFLPLAARSATSLGFGIDQIERARQVVPIAAVQNHYDLTERRYEDVVDYCAEAGIVFVPYFPLRGNGRRPLTEIAERHGATHLQITLAWLLKRSPTMLPIPGTLSVQHMKDNLAALEIELSDQEFEALR
jgi:aryl-alcohol dehydrogenase-like predicted oxidoreductase